MSKMGLAIGWLLACGVALAACSAEPDVIVPVAPPTCGDGVCSAAQCESMLRCPKDCGVCTGSKCDEINPNKAGSCGEPCTSSCGCYASTEYCTADLTGEATGICLPMACRNCGDGLGTQCNYAPDASGQCPSIACEV